MEPKVATVSQINGYIKKILDKNIILNNVWVKGELSNFKVHYSGHIYTTLKDEGGVLKAVMFRSAASKLPFEPSNGMKVMARGRVAVYEAGGAYQLYIEEMIPDGVGALYVAYEQLKAKLESEGLFSPQYKKPIPKYPSKIGVATATTGAAVRDIINVATRRYPLAEIIIYPTKVQGQGAAESIVSAIKYFNTENRVDTIIAGRGGGSIEDLWAFNEEIVARAIFQSQIPIISAVGHETDFTIADFVADLRAPTPSAAAEIAVPSSAELMHGLKVSENRLSGAVLKAIDRKRLILKNIKLKTPIERVHDNSIRLDSYTKALVSGYKMKLMSKKQRLMSAAGKLDAMSPLKVLSRGYAIPESHEGHIIRSAKEMNTGDEFILRLNDGEKECIVK